VTAVITVWQDIACPWATLAVYRLDRARTRLGLTDRIGLDLRAFPLELINSRPTPKGTLDAEIPVVGGLEPDFGWRRWRRREWEWPVTTLGALEAVYAAKEQALQVSEELDMALRRALFCDSRTISMHHEILNAAEAVDGLDLKGLTTALESGRFRPQVFDDYRIAQTTKVKGSPHLFLPDSTDVHNPGVELHWTDDHGYPIVDKDDPGIYETLLMRAIEAGTKEEFSDG
jgi:predicted DsbA family dithiol-disulfide isomerase